MGYSKDLKKAHWREGDSSHHGKGALYTLDGGEYSNTGEYHSF